MNKQRVNLFLTPGIVEKAKHQALNENISLSELVDKALDEYLPPVIIVDDGSKEMKIEFVGAENVSAASHPKGKKNPMGAVSEE